MNKVICIDIKSIKDVSPYEYGSWKVGNTYLVMKDLDKATIYNYDIHTLNKDYINSVTTEEYNNSFITVNDWRQQQLNTILDE